MADTTTLNYVVDSIDTTYNVLKVTFPDDGTSVNIQFTVAPTTQADLDALVAPYAKHQEVVAAPVDTTFIKSIVGKTHKTTRYSLAGSAAVLEAKALAATAAETATVAAASSNDFVIANTTKAQAQSNMKQADIDYIKGLIAEVLASQSASSTASTTTETAASTAS